jgi:DNA-binding CsgD family transcriptional regulator
VIKQVNNKIELTIASKHCLITNGIQAMIGMLGLNVDYHEFQGFNYLFEKHNNQNHHLILHHHFLNQPKKDHLKLLSDQFKGEIMVIGNERVEADFHAHMILTCDDEMTIIQKLEDFFSIADSKAENGYNETLSIREVEILKEVALGYSNKEIADRLFISINTVITHRKNITDKLGIKTIAGLTVYALMNNLINPKDVTI